MRIEKSAALCVACAAVIFSGCARAPEDIGASYVSPVLYQSLSCEQLAQEAQRVSGVAAQASGVQQKNVTRDRVVTGVGIVVFWPALFWLKGDNETSYQIARLKGEMDAIEQTSIAKNCGIEFRATPPPNEKVAAKEAPYPTAR